VSPSSTPSVPGVAVPTEVEAGQSGALKNANAVTSHQGVGGIALLTLGGLLVLAGILKARQTRGNHSA
jgi:hypothetical protein